MGRMKEMADRQPYQLARSHDRGTSHQAADLIQPQLGSLQQLLLSWARMFKVRIGGSWTDQEMVAEMQRLHGRGASTWRTRRAELVSSGHIIKTGTRLVNGRNHTMWSVP